MVIVSHHRVGRHACFLRFHGNVLNSDNKHPPRLIILLTLLFIRPRSYTSVPYGNISHTFPITPIFARRYYVQQPSADDKLTFTLSTHCRRQKRWNIYKEKVPVANMYADAPYFQESMFKSNKIFHKFLWDEPCISPQALEKPANNIDLLCACSDKRLTVLRRSRRLFSAPLFLPDFYHISSVCIDFLYIMNLLNDSLNREDNKWVK